MKIFFIYLHQLQNNKKTNTIKIVIMNTQNIYRNLFLLFAFLLSTNLIFSQNIISGTVADEEGNALPGVSIVEKGTSNGTVSDFDGNFQLNVGDAATIVFSYIGYVTQKLEPLLQ